MRKSNSKKVVCEFCKKNEINSLNSQHVKLHFIESKELGGSLGSDETTYRTRSETIYRCDECHAIAQKYLKRDNSFLHGCLSIASAFFLIIILGVSFDSGFVEGGILVIFLGYLWYKLFRYSDAESSVHHLKHPYISKLNDEGWRDGASP